MGRGLGEERWEGVRARRLEIGRDGVDVRSVFASIIQTNLNFPSFPHSLPDIQIFMLNKCAMLHSSSISGEQVFNPPKAFYA